MDICEVLRPRYRGLRDLPRRHARSAPMVKIFDQVLRNCYFRRDPTFRLGSARDGFGRHPCAYRLSSVA